MLRMRPQNRSTVLGSDNFNARIISPIITKTHRRDVRDTPVGVKVDKVVDLHPGKLLHRLRL
jgi:hypothetical protein